MDKKPVKKIIVSQEANGRWSWSGYSSTGGRIFDSSWNYNSKASAIARAKIMAAQLDVLIEIKG